VTAANDPVLTPAMSAGMEKLVTHLTRLSVEHASHWVHHDQPAAVNEGLIHFLAALRH